MSMTTLTTATTTKLDGLWAVSVENHGQLKLYIQNAAPVLGKIDAIDKHAEAAPLAQRHTLHKGIGAAAKKRCKTRETYNGCDSLVESCRFAFLFQGGNHCNARKRSCYQTTKMKKVVLSTKQ